MANLIDAPSSEVFSPEDFDRLVEDRRAQDLHGREVRKTHTRVASFILSRVGRDEQNVKRILEAPTEPDEIRRVAADFDLIAVEGLCHTFERLEIGQRLNGEQFLAIRAQLQGLVEALDAAPPLPKRQPGLS